MNKLLALAALLGVALAVPSNHTSKKRCDQNPISEVSGSLAWQGFCIGDMIFYDNFDDLQLDRWTHEEWNPGNVNGEFQQYVNSRDNSYVQDSNLHIRVTTDNNPVKSARMHSRDSFNFKYGLLEIRAKLPAGDWLWPALWLMPKDSVYGEWPASGEIDMIEGRGNRQLVQDGNNIGVEHVGSTLHFGPSWDHDAWATATYGINDNNPSYADGFHVFQLEWTTDHIRFIVDGRDNGVIYPSDGGFYNWGNFGGLNNPWGNANNYRMAPFDQQFYIILNLAVVELTGTSLTEFPTLVPNLGLTTLHPLQVISGMPVMPGFLPGMVTMLIYKLTMSRSLLCKFYHISLYVVKNKTYLQKL